MRRFLLCHRHAPRECRVAFASWRGFESPLRRRETIGSCVLGGHAIWWTVDAEDTGAALALLPRYMAERTEAVEVAGVMIP